MSKWMEKAGWLFLLLFCMGVGSSCSSGQEMAGAGSGEEREADAVQEVLPEEALEGPVLTVDTEEADMEEGEEVFSPEGQAKKNEILFFEEAEKQNIGIKPAEELYGRLLEDQIFQNGLMALTGLRIDDIDGNGQIDMLVMVMDAEEKPFYGSGGLWFYMNGDEPYCFEEEDCSFYGWFDVFWDDIDNDENVEVVFSAQGTGCGAVGDFYKAVFKYKDHAITRMALPSDLEEDYDCGLQVELIQEPEINSYSAYCPYFDEQIFFQRENIEGYGPSDHARTTGGNARGFYDLCVAQYEGKKALQASEYLYGEGGIVHNVAVAQFLITWEEDGTPKVVKWWIKEEKSGWANSHESRICYADGYYYYASQLDHYYLYRAREDGGQPECLAKIHAGSLCVQDDEIYFIDQGSDYGDYGSVCKMKTDGSGMETLCEQGRSLQLSAEYIYFCAAYEAAYDKSGIVTEESYEFSNALEMPFFLYRMKKDGSEKELVAADVWQYTLSRRNGYTGSIYCSKWIDHKIAVFQMDLNGINEEEICRFDKRGTLMAYDNVVYYVGDFYGNREQISQYHSGHGKTTTVTVPEYTDCCIYKGRFCGLNEEVSESGRKITIYRMNYTKKDYDILYQNSFSCPYADGIYLSDLYASEEGIFFRQFVSPEEGCRWFRLEEDAETGQWVVEKWEDAEATPVALPARNIEYGELRSVTSVLESTEGWDAYLADPLEYEEFYATDENGQECNPYQICLPQFNDKIEGYQKINRYFQNNFHEMIAGKEDFFDMLEESGSASANWYQSVDYGYLYIGEKYITAGIYEEGYSSGIRNWIALHPATFDRKTGEKVTLETILDMPAQEAVASLTGSVYKYMEGMGRGSFLLKEDDILSKNYDPEQFFLFPDGIGIYYERYAIDCGAAGDYLFVVPFDL